MTNQQVLYYDEKKGFWVRGIVARDIGLSVFVDSGSGIWHEVAKSELVVLA